MQRSWGRRVRWGGVLLAAWLAAASPARGRQAAPAQPPGGVPRVTATVADEDRVDINTASLERLRALPGMGWAYAERVIRFRPYTSRLQLYSRGVLPMDAYLRIEGMVVARRPRKR